VLHSHPAKPAAALGLSICIVLVIAAPPAGASVLGTELSFGGSLALTTDYIYRGLAESDGRGAVQLDAHATTAEGTFAGTWFSTRDRALAPGAGYDLEVYLGQRIDLGSAWNTSVSARSHHYLGSAPGYPSDDYQELTASLAWLDRWTVSASLIPSAVRYWYYGRLPRSLAWTTDTSGQWLLGQGVFITAGAGYYRSTANGPGREGASGYGYGNAGVAFEYRRWRLDVGYFLAATQAEELFAYPIANHRVAGTVSWHF
jgi:uncharacterized protein (TIGR02001 family)